MKKLFRDPGGITYAGLLILLSVSAVFFLLMDLQPFQTGPRKLYTRATEKPVDVLGICAVACYDGFERRGAMDDRENLAGAVDRIREPLTRALDTARAPEEAKESDWRLALASRGIYIRLLGQVPGELFWDSFDIPDCPVETDLTGLVLCVRENRVDLFLECGDGYRVLSTDLEQSAVTALSFADLPYLRLAAELGSPYTESLPPDTLISEEQVPALRRMQGISFGPEGFDRLSRLLTAFFVNPYTDSAYTGEDGTRIYKTDIGTLSVTEDGQVLFEGENGNGILPDPEEGRTDLQRGLSCLTGLFRSALGTDSLSSFYLQRVDYAGERTLFHFGLRVGNIPVEEAGVSYEALGEMEEGRILRVRFRFCGLERDDRILVTDFITRSEVLRGRDRWVSLPGLVYYMQNDVASPVWIS